MKVDIDHFVSATKALHAADVKHTRLMLKVRPHSRAEQKQRIFILKATDGKTVYTTRVNSLAELKKVEGLVNEFVSTCTRDVLPPPPPPPFSTATSAAAATTQPPATAQSSSASQTHGASSSNIHKGKQQQQQQQQHGGKGSKSGKKGKK